MQISLRSQMIAGTTALMGATAIAMTPIAPAVQLPALSVSKANVALAAWDSPVVALVDTVNTAVNYLINSDYATGTDSAAVNWGYESGISDLVNDDFLPASYWNDGSGYLPAIYNVGLIPNFISNPFPAATQLVNNWFGYANTAWQAGGIALEGLVYVLRAPVALSVGILNAVLTGQIANIPTIISAAVAEVVNDLTISAQAVVGAATTIVQSIVARATETVRVLAAAVPAALANVGTQLSTVATTAQTVVGNITTSLASGDINGAWNAAVTGLLSPGIDGSVSIPGDLLNLTLGAGVQLGDVTDSASYRANFVPSIRNELQSLGQGLQVALQTPVVASSAAVVRPAAAAKAAAATSAATPAKKATAKVGRHAASAKAAAAK